MSAALTARCPFCGAAASGVCPGCGRDPTARRRVCGSCKKMTPIAEPACCHCKRVSSSELPGKVMIIVLLFAAAFALAIALRFVR